MLLPEYDDSSSSESEIDEGVALTLLSYSALKFSSMRRQVHTGNTNEKSLFGDLADIPLTDRLLDDGERASADEAPQIKKRLLPDASELFEQVLPSTERC